MNDEMRIDLVGRDAEAWHRVFDKLTGVIVRGVEAITPEEKGEQRKADFIKDVATLTKNWLGAKAERPSLENEKLMAEIICFFEDAKLKRANTERVEIENEMLKLDLLQKRVMTAVNLMGFLRQHIIRAGDGSLALVLTNENLLSMHGQMKSITENPAQA